MRPDHPTRTCGLLLLCVQLNIQPVGRCPHKHAERMEWSSSRVIGAVQAITPIQLLPFESAAQLTYVFTTYNPPTIHPRLRCPWHQWFQQFQSQTSINIKQRHARHRAMRFAAATLRCEHCRSDQLDPAPVGSTGRLTNLPRLPPCPQFPLRQTTIHCMMLCSVFCIIRAHLQVDGIPSHPIPRGPVPTNERGSRRRRPYSRPSILSISL